MKRIRSLVLTTIAAGLTLSPLNGSNALHAQQYAADRPLGETAQQPPRYLRHAGIEQRLNQSLPLSVSYTNESNVSAPLSHWISKRPTVLALVYYKCTMMCPEVLRGLAEGLKQTHMIPGKDYDIVTFSIDPTDSAADAAIEKANFLRTLGLPGAADALHFLTGSPASIEAISSSTGFQYVRVPGPDGKLDQFAHSSVIMFATPDGTLSKYISGVEYSPRDLRLALLDASQKKISNPVDLVLIYCCSYNPVAGKYSVAVLRVVSIAGMTTLVGVGGLLMLVRRRA